MNYLKMIRDAIRDAMPNGPFWTILPGTLDLDHIETAADAVKEYMENMSACKTITKSNYTEKLFNINTAFYSVRSYYYGDDEYTKRS